MYKGFYKRPSGWTYLVREDLKYLGFGGATEFSSKVNLKEDQYGEGFGITPRYEKSHKSAVLVIPREFT